MKARVKATGETVEVVSNGLYYESMKDERNFDKHELEFPSNIKEPDYWEKLKHQYAGMAMQGILTNLGNTVDPDYIVEEAEAYATALVEKLKNSDI